MWYSLMKVDLSTEPVATGSEIEEKVAAMFSPLPRLLRVVTSYVKDFFWYVE